MVKFLGKMYIGLGSSKEQRFRRLFAILVLISAVLIVGFYTGAIDFVISVGSGAVSE